MATGVDRGGDPARSLALLWGDQRRSKQRSRSDLSVEKIVLTAIDLADADGLGVLSMRQVAQTLGVGVMSLYTYVPGKAELIDVMLDTVYGETAKPDDIEGGWRPKLELVARENWALRLRHPWMLQIPSGRPSLGPNALAKYEFELRAVEGIGLSDLEMDSVVSLVSDHAEGAARRAVDALRLERGSGMTDEQWWLVYGPLLSSVVDVERYPTAAKVGTAAGSAHGTAYPAEHAFDFGLERLLDGIEALVEHRAMGSGPA
ncbi:TetR/AcrR family transcriptional regulator [Actinokineospora sp. PR83]|uniref:TetR/AcrR family transcriptional regulator n=1 Tax=Actinokineospora sp. PR83 TaxID=2884908 RepID=UPI0027E0E34A|nr:TetR/AcrR family transcriptional regulator C-terminal domain-containing protein [Actinokineospora sp. PR83]MCG8920586.1 TetR/AcrR family transcriptional regulator [Actinokineospora sp. PR83]